MSLLLIPSEFNPTHWINALQKEDPNLKMQIWPNVTDPEAIEFALVWWYPHGELRKYPNLKCIASIGAGVDFILNDPDRPEQVPIVRIIDPLLTRDMAHYVILAVLNYVREFDHYHENQLRHLWIPKTMPLRVKIGIMGLGEMGAESAIKLRDLGFDVIGWSRTAKQLTGIRTYSGQEQLHEFLAQADVLVCLLPLTSATQNILNRDTFKRLPKGAYVINAARGAHLVDEDLIAAIDNQQLAGACLDVFRVEPLPADHPFWRHPKIHVTPHIASKTNPASVARQIIDNYKRATGGKPLLNQVDTLRGY